jgi:cupin fold WbuC family metalloprotein
MTPANPSDVMFGTGGVVRVDANGLDLVRGQAMRSARKRARLCAHPGTGHSLHEMLICLAQETYIRPHRHAGKSESFHMIEGELDVVLFHDDGTVREVIPMGTHASGKVFYYRLDECCFHTVLVATEHAIFHETTSGPFDPADTEFAIWSPPEGDPAAIGYREHLRELVNRLD